ncbi:GAP family protein [Catellatospora vulcania]|uniref:GAP family protein n=1 Tax=Catellatospora vulcania TaxID=1460450 RepID=UPI0012D495EA|nr:GAP family protein [Catellatospora vulcania]
MGGALAGVMPYALGVAASPLPIIAVILVLFSDRARIAGPAFLAGALAGVIAVSAAVYLLSGYGYLDGDHQGGTVSQVVRIGLGLVLLFAGYLHLARHRRAKGQHAMPKWMASADRWSPVKAAILALLMYGVDPKNLALCAGAAKGLAASSTVVAMVALSLFAVVACLPVAVPVILYLVGGDRAARHLDRLKTWLSKHHLLVMAGLLVVFGVLLISHGVRGLLGH